MVPSIFLENLCKGKILCDRCFLALGTNEVPHHLEQANWIRVGIVSLYKKNIVGVVESFIHSILQPVANLPFEECKQGYSHYTILSFCHQAIQLITTSQSRQHLSDCDVFPHRHYF